MGTKIVLCSRAFIAFAFMTLSVCAVHVAEAKTLTIGTLNKGMRSQLESFGALSDYLERNLRSAGVTEVRVLMLASSELMSGALSRGEVDLFIESPVVAARVAQHSGATPFLRDWRGGRSNLFSLVVVSQDSGISDLSDLIGKRIAFESKDSSAGFLLPAHLFVIEDIPLKFMRNVRGAPAPAAVNYVFTSHDKNSVYLLATNHVDAAATDIDGFGHLDAARPGEFKVIATSQPVPRQVVLHRKDMDTDLLEDLRSVLIDMFRSRQGRDVLAAFFDTAGFDEFPRGVKETFAPIYRILDDLEHAGVR